jgi:hypothetical protein
MNNLGRRKKLIEMEFVPDKKLESIKLLSFILTMLGFIFAGGSLMFGFGMIAFVIGAIIAGCGLIGSIISNSVLT